MKIRDIIKNIETKFDTEKIKSHNLALWLEIRNKYYFNLSIGKSSLVINSKLYLNVLSTFFYGFLNWFKKYDSWVLSSNLNRLLVDDKYFDKLFDYPASKFNKTLFIELTATKHYKRKNVFSKYIVSRSPLIIFEKFLSLFISTKKIDTTILQEIQNEFGGEFDTKHSIKKMISQYKTMKLLLLFKSTPKVVFIAPAYMSFGYIKALKEKKVTIIEAQHGVINNEHFGYSFFGNFGKNYFPDYLLTFGENEKKIFEYPNVFINQENVIPVGSYYIDYILNKFKFKIDTSNYKMVFSVSMQDCETGSLVLPFIINVAKANSNCLFLMKPRRTEVSVYKARHNIPKNVHFVNDLDVYQTILHSDYHITAFSSCALEAPALGVKNILLNINKKAFEYYGDTLNSNTTVFVENEIEFNTYIKELEKVEKDVVKSYHKSVMKANYKSNIDNFIKSINFN